jgi:trimeric autotransporter adhesin
LRILGRKRAAVAAVGLAALATASVANAAVMQQKPAASYQANGTVRSIIIVGDTAYMGGQFTAMIPSGGGTAVTRNHLAAVDMTTGGLLPWNPNANGTVYTLLASGGNVYVGGSFKSVGGAAHKNLAEVNGSSGAVVSSFANSLKPNKAVRGLAVSPAGNVYVGGAFTKPWPYAAEVNGTTGARIPAFAPVISNTHGTSPEVRAIAVDPSGTRVILGGFFNMLNSGAPGDPNTTNLGVGAVDPTTGASLPWAWHTSDLQTFRPFQVLEFVQDGTMLIGAGTGNGGSAISWNIETGALNYIEGFNGNVAGIGATDGVLYMGGHFSEYCGPIPGSNFVCAGLPGSAARDKLAAVDEATGQTLESWHPSVNTSLGIEAMAAANDTLAIGGEFTKVGGVSQQHFARFTE